MGNGPMRPTTETLTLLWSLEFFGVGFCKSVTTNPITTKHRPAKIITMPIGSVDFMINKEMELYL